MKNLNPIVIDTDPGVDDFLALLFAIKADLNIRGITTVYGNANIENTTKNALTILEILNKDIKVYKGASRPLVKDPVIAQSHGENGLGGFKLKNIDRQEEGKDAVSFFIEELERTSEKITFLCLGPVTNFAILFNLRPDLIEKVKEMIILGGVFHERGNISDYAEFNVYNDPDALKQVLDLKVKKVLIPINICRKVTFSKKELDHIGDKSLAKNINKIVSIYIDYYEKDEKYGGFKGGVMYDLLTVVFFLDPSLFNLRSAYVEVDVEDTEVKAKTSIRSSAKSNAVMCTEVDSDGLKNMFYSKVT